MKREEYIKDPKLCLQCNIKIEYEFKNNKFCSQSCCAIFNNKKRCKIAKKKCVLCGKIIRHKTNIHCSNCISTINYNEYIFRWKNNLESGLCGKQNQIIQYIRKYMFEKYNSKCCKCGWSEINTKTGKIPLQINHIDGNHKNNKEENLELLCPNCHSLTHNFGSLNKGYGRSERYNKI